MPSSCVAAAGPGASLARPSRVPSCHAVAAPDTKPAEGPIILDGLVLHSIEPHRLDIVRSMEHDGWVENNLSKMLKPVEKSWQPADYLPDAADPDFIDKVCNCCIRLRSVFLHSEAVPPCFLLATNFLPVVNPPELHFSVLSVTE